MIKLDYLPYVPSPNKSSRDGGVKPTWIVLHTMSGYYGTPGKSGTIFWFQNPKSKVSAHYLVSKQGEITCMVKPEMKAWHTKGFNNVSLGIEMEDKDPKTKLMSDKDPKWCTEKELNAVAELVATLMVKYKISLANVIGHNDPMLAKPPYNNDHKDPNKYWNWEKFRTLVKKHLEPPKEKKSE